MQNNARPYRRLSILLAGLMLLSAVGLRLDVHYCQGQLSGVSLILPEMAPCGQTEKAACCNQDTQDLPCCQDEETIASLDYDGPLASQMTFDDPGQQTIIPCSAVRIGNGLTHKSKWLLDRGPPLETLPSGMETRIRYQSFLC